MTDFLTQAAWAKRLGVSVQTFRVWRGLGLIPLPAPLPGHPRWSVEVVERTTAKLKIVRRGLFQRREGQRSFQSRSPRPEQQQRSNHGPLVSRQSVNQHAASVAEPQNSTPLNSPSSRAASVDRQLTALDSNGG